MSKQLFPNPPSYYKHTYLTPPDESILGQIDTLNIFGKVYHVKKTAEITSDFENNSEIQNNINTIKDNLMSDFDIDDIELMRVLLYRLKTKYVQFLKTIKEKIDSSDDSLKDIKSVLDMFHYTIHKLKTKQLIIKTKELVLNNIIIQEEKIKESIHYDLTTVSNNLNEICSIVLN